MAANVALALVYFVVAKLGLRLAGEFESVTPVWPPTGLSLAALVLLGFRFWPGVALGAFVANLTTGDTSAATALGIAGGNTLEAVAGAWFLTRMGFQPWMPRLRDVALLLFCAVGSTTLSATFGTTSLLLSDAIASSDYRSAWTLWWVGDTMGDLLVAPLLFVWASERGYGLIRSRPFEAAALAATAMLAAVLTFGGDQWRYPVALFPVLVWASLRFRQKGATAAVIVITGTALWLTLEGSEPFPGADQTVSIQLLQSLVAVAALTALAVAANLTERERAATATKVQTERLGLLTDIAVAANFAETAEEAFQTALDRVCAYTEWPVGHVFYVEDQTRLVSSGLWHLDDPVRYESFRTATTEILLRRGFGLPGRVLESGKPEWSEDVTQDLSFLRAPAASTSGLRSAFAFPVVSREEIGAVIEFFASEPHYPDEELLWLMSFVGVQLGRALERTEAQAALKREENRARRIIETATDAFIGIDDQSEVTDWNRAAEMTFGWPREEAIGKKLYDLVIPERHREQHITGIKHFLSTGEGPVLFNRIELTALHRSGREFPVELTVWPIRIGDAWRFSAFVNDITERKQAAEYSLRLSEAELRRREALELNDSVVQGLVVAKYALELGQGDKVADVLATTLESARRIIGRLLEDAQGRIDVGPGRLTRETPAIGEQGPRREVKPS